MGCRVAFDIDENYLKDQLNSINSFLSELGNAIHEESINGTTLFILLNVENSAVD